MKTAFSNLAEAAAQFCSTLVAYSFHRRHSNEFYIHCIQASTSSPTGGKNATDAIDVYIVEW